MAKKSTKKKTTTKKPEPQAQPETPPAPADPVPAAAEKKKTTKPKKITTSRIRFVRRHKGFMPGDEIEQTGGVAKTLVQIGAAEFLTRKGVPCNPDGSPKKK